MEQQIRCSVFFLENLRNQKEGFKTLLATQHFTKIMCLAPKSKRFLHRNCPEKTPQKQLPGFFCIQFLFDRRQAGKNYEGNFLVLQLSKRVGTVSVPFLRKWPKHKCELGYEGKPIEIEFAVMQRKSREETCFLLEGHFKG